MIINNKKKYPLRDRKKKGFFFATHQKQTHPFVYFSTHFKMTTR